MTQQEFEQRTGFITTPEHYEEVEAKYMASELDKDMFCKVWVKQGGIEEMSDRMREQILTLRSELAEEHRKREAEREHADAALTQANAYAKELTRIFNLEKDYNAMRTMLNKLVSEYKLWHR
jgi:hypothetical protein